MLLQLPLVIPLQFMALALSGAHSILWRYVGLIEFTTFVKAALMAAAALLLLRLDPLGMFGVGSAVRIPLSVIFIDTLLAFSGVLALRVTRRMVFEYLRKERRPADTAPPPARKSVLLVGAGQAGIGALQAIQGRAGVAILPVGFVDDDPGKQGSVVHGVRVPGFTTDLPRLVRSMNIDHVVITIARGSRRDLCRIVEQCERIPVKVRIIPNFFELFEGNVEAKIRAVEIEDLLGRQPVVLDQDLLTPFLTGKRVLVTGAGGSIGSEMCRQVAASPPSP